MIIYASHYKKKTENKKKKKERKIRVKYKAEEKLMPRCPRMTLSGGVILNNNNFLKHSIMNKVLNNKIIVSACTIKG